MYKILLLLSLTFLFNGCVESIALLGSSVGGASSGKILQSSINSTISYGVKKQTGKSPLGHALSYAEEKNHTKNVTKANINNEKTLNNSSNEITSSLQPLIDEKSKIKYLDK